MSPVRPTIKTEILPIIFIVLSVIISFYFYANFPDQVATHWNFEGQVDDYSSKTFASIFMPIMLIGIYLIFLLIPYLDPQKERYQQFAKVYHIFKNMIIGFMFIIYVITGLANLGYPINISLVIPVLVGILFIVIGNYMGKIKYNWFMGIRTPWTLSSENVWNKTHRVGGWVFIVLGIIMMLMPVMPQSIIMPAFFVSIFTLVVGIFVYSYFLYRAEKK